MFAIIKSIMTIRGLMAGYKLYLGAFLLFLGSLSAWGLEVFIPFLDGGMSVVTLIQSSPAYFAAMGMAMGISGLQSAIED